MQVLHHVLLVVVLNYKLYLLVLQILPEKIDILLNNTKSAIIYKPDVHDMKLTLDSSAVSDKTGGSSKQKNSLTHETPMRIGLLNMPLTNA